MIDTISFIIQVDNHSDAYPRETVDIIINGRNLVDIIREIEQTFANREGAPGIAGKYMGLRPHVILLPSRHLLGEPVVFYSSKQGKTQLLQCTCGEPGCWPLRARVIVSETHVTWTDFEQPYRGPTSRASHWRYDALPDFVFDRAAYEAALNPVIESQ